MNRVLNMTYASSLTMLCEVNSSFDTGVLRICYTGKNRNGSFISKEAINKSIKTIYNCPIVCNYNRDTGTLGGHDMEVVHDNDGTVRIVNITQPVGVIPESARIWFENYKEDDGTTHEYLCAETLLWKRQEAYRKIKEDGITAHSMEITVKDGGIEDGIYYINEFEFTAFALIGEEPCFEGSAIEVFSKQDFKQQLSEMMHDLKESFKQVDTSSEVDNKHPQNYSMEGGERVLEDKMKLASEYGIDVDALGFAIDDFTVEELTEKFEAMKSDPGECVSKPEAPAINDENSFALTGNIVEELRRVLEQEEVTHEWGSFPRYLFADCDFDIKEVYCWDTSDWLLYGFIYIIDGDSITIDYESKKRMKYIIADFDEGDQESPFAPVFVQIESKLSDESGWKNKYNSASETITAMEEELNELRKFEADIKTSVAKDEREKIFAQFEDLFGIEAFETLRENCMEYDVETIEDKCYAIRGRNGIPAKFSVENKTPKLKVEKTATPKEEPYGGIFARFGIGNDN